MADASDQINVLLSDISHQKILGPFISKRLSRYGLKPVFKQESKDLILNVIDCANTSTEGLPEDDRPLPSTQSVIRRSFLLSKLWSERSPVERVFLIGLTSIALFLVGSSFRGDPVPMYTEDSGERSTLLVNTLKKIDFRFDNLREKIFKNKLTLEAMGGYEDGSLAKGVDAKLLRDDLRKQKMVVNSFYMVEGEIMYEDLNGKKRVFSVTFTCLKDGLRQNPSNELIELQKSENLLGYRALGGSPENSIHSDHKMHYVDYVCINIK